MKTAVDLFLRYVAELPVLAPFKVGRCVAEDEYTLSSRPKYREAARIRRIWRGNAWACDDLEKTLISVSWARDDLKRRTMNLVFGGGVTGRGDDHMVYLVAWPPRPEWIADASAIYRKRMERTHGYLYDSASDTLTVLDDD